MTSRAGLLAALVLLFPAPIHAEPIYFEGVFEPSDTGSYERLTFDLQEGVTAINVMYEYEVDGEQGSLLRNVVDLGVYDPAGFRGWSGSERASVTLAVDDKITTPGYVPGPLPAGTWFVELGAGLVADDTTTSWTVTIALSQSADEPFVPPEPANPVLGGMGWYSGDLHCHSVHSDGSATVGEVFEFAHQRGLDFLALSDHNNFTGHYEMPELQDRYDDLLLMRGMEVTTYRGHANVFGLTAYVDYHASEDGYDLTEVLQRVHHAGGLFSVNHPDQVGYTNADGTFTTLGWAVDGTDWDQVDGFEVLNSATTWQGLSNPFNVEALAHWDELLAEGFRPTAVGGSDDHKGGDGSEDDLFWGAIGTPTTVVFAEELSQVAILDGIRAGHVYIKANGPDGPDLFLEATCGRTALMLGDEGTGPAFDAVARAEGAEGLTLRIVRDAEVIEEVEVTSGDFEYPFEVVPDDRTVVRLELRDGDLIEALTNPVYLTFSDTPCPALGDDDDSASPIPLDDGCACASQPRALRGELVVALLLLAAVVRRR